MEKKTHHVMLRFSDEEWLKFLAMYEQTEVRAKAVFAKARIFGEEFHVFREDRTLVEYYAKLYSACSGRTGRWSNTTPSCPPSMRSTA